ncbi:MAG: hypothetical protein QGG05_15320, partial [Candidatus Latescibacteria bacterium]|nr:hypothetical protein [Candidatus Latescibacterota bacterium]
AVVGRAKAGEYRPVESREGMEARLGVTRAVVELPDDLAVVQQRGRRGRLLPAELPVRDSVTRDRYRSHYQADEERQHTDDPHLAR